MERGDKRDAIIDAMIDLVATHGFHATPMALVAERAGVGAGTIYRYFEDKDALIAACYQGLKDRFHEAVMEGYPEGRPVRERFLHLGAAVIRHFLETPRDFRFIQQFFDSPYGVDVRREKMFGHEEKDLARDLLEEARAQQITKDLPLPVHFALFFGPLTNVCRDHILGFLTLDDDLIRETLEAAWDALKR
jgi:AcrR family transcriptional regulator